MTSLAARCRGASALLAALYLLTPNPSLAASPGSLPTTTDVNLFSGAFTPKVPLDVLPALGGHAPELALVYSAQLPNGWLGAGWELDIGSAITRRGPNRSIPNLGASTFDPDPGSTFYVDGQELIPAGGGTYRAERDPFTVYEPLFHTEPMWQTPLIAAYYSGPPYPMDPTPVTRIVAWKATRNGTVRTWGTPTGPDHCRDATDYGAPSGCMEPLRWRLSTIEDPLGNRIDLSYASATWSGADTHQLRLDEILYNVQGQDAHVVSMVYEDRPDVRSTSRDGIHRVMSQRLAAIEVIAVRGGVDHLSHRFRFDYRMADGDAQSLLQAVVREGSAGSEMTLKRFVYADLAPSAHPGWAAWAPVPVVGPPPTPPGYDFTDADTSKSYDSRPMLLDVDRDARPDYVVLNTECEVSVQAGNGQGGEEGQQEGGEDPEIISVSECHPEHQVYLNRPEVPGEPRFEFDPILSAQLDATLGPIRQSFSGDNRDHWFMDINADGWPDLILGDGAPLSRQAVLGSENGWDHTDPTQVIPLPWMSGTTNIWPFRDDLRPVDINGDGFADLATDDGYYPNTGTAPWFHKGAIQPIVVHDPSGTALPSPADMPPVSPTGSCMAASDGGRYPDNALGVGVSSGGGPTLFQVPADTVSPREWVWQHTTFRDVNGDGITDRVVALTWPEAGTTGAAAIPVWRMDPACGGVNRVDLGDGRGHFWAQAYGVGGDYGWYGGPTAATAVETERQTHPSLTFTFSAPDIHVGYFGLDGAGRSALTQICNSVLHRLPDLGLATTLGGAGYGIGPGAGLCPSGALALPSMYTGGSPTGMTFGTTDDGVQSTMADLDGDGLADFFVSHNPISPLATSRAGGPQPMWRANLRTTAQNRLVEIIEAHGGVTTIDWTTSTLDPDNDVPAVVPVPASIDGARGLTTYRFSGAWAEQDRPRFVGFRYAEASGTSGNTKRFEHLVQDGWRGARLYGADFHPDGSLHTLDVSLLTRGSGWTPADTSAPFYNPETRSCRFDFYAAYAGSDPGPLVTECVLMGYEPIPGSPDYRLHVEEKVHDTSLGVVTEIRHLADPTRLDDTTLTTFGYHPYDATLVASLRASSRTQDLGGDVREDLEWPLADYFGPLWGTEVQHGSGSSRTRERAFAGGALAWETRWGPSHRVDYEYDACGLILQATDPIAWTRTTRDEVCRALTHEKSSGLVESRLFDDLGRTTQETIIISGSPDQVTRFDYDSDAQLGDPASVRLQEEPDGSQTALLTYLDGYGRDFMQVRCQRDATLPSTWTSSLLDAYACAGDDPLAGDYAATRLTLHDASVGRPVVTSDWFDARDGVAVLSASATLADTVPEMTLSGTLPLTVKTLDGIGRISTETAADGVVTTIARDVGQTDRTARGVTHTILEDTVSKSLYRNGVLSSRQELNAFSEVIAELDALSNQTDHEYDRFGRRISTQGPAVDVYTTCGGPPASQRPTTTTTWTDADQRASVTSPGGDTTTYRYDPIGRVIETEGPDGALVETRTYVDGSGSTRRVEITDDLGNVTTRWLDAADRVWRTDHPDGTATSSSYDLRGRESQRVRPFGAVVAFGYGRDGHLTQLEETMDTVVALTTVRFNARGQKLMETDADGVVEEWVRDIAGRVLAHTIGDPALGMPRLVASNFHDAFGRVEERTLEGVLERLSYDAEGRLVEVARGWDPGAAKTELEKSVTTWTARDEVESRTNALTEGVVKDYDAMGRVVAEHIVRAGAVLATRSYGYDVDGRLIREEDEEGLVTCRTYDGYGRVTSVSPSGAGTTTLSYARGVADPLGASTQWQLQTTETRPTGEVTDRWTDGMGRTWLTQHPDGRYTQRVFTDGLETLLERLDSSGAALSVKAWTHYPDSDRVAEALDWMEPSTLSACLAAPASCPTGSVAQTWTDAGRLASLTDADGNTTTVTYAPDGSGLVSELWLSGVTEVRYEYDPIYALRVANEVGPSSDPIRTEWTRDRNLHLSELIRERTSTGDTEVSRYSYDDAGRRVFGLFERGGTTESVLSWDYDGFGRVRTKTYEIDGLLYNAPGAGYSFKWTYRDNGQLESVTYPSGNLVSYWYDPLGRLERVNQGGTYGSPSVAELSNHDPSGRPLRTRIGGNQVDRTFVDGREVSRTVAGSAGVAFDEAYTWDGLGRLAHTRRNYAGGSFEDVDYTYDARDLLIGESRVTPTGTSAIEYDVDAAGRRSEKRVWDGATLLSSEAYSYWPGNRLAGVGSATLSLSDWDDYGRQLADQRGQALAWGLSSQLTSVTDVSGVVETMAHDVDGQRVSRTVAGATDVYLSGDFSGMVMHHQRPDGTTQDVVRGPGGGVLAYLSGAGVVSELAAGRADALMAFGDASAPAAERAYSAFGELLDGDATGESQMGFHQTWATEASALRIAGVRPYDPDTGRFLATDPFNWAAAPDPNDAADAYRYAQSNPVAMQDSTGYLAMMPPVQGTTISVDGMIIEVLSVEAWSNGTIQLPDGVTESDVAAAEAKARKAALEGGSPAPEEPTEETWTFDPEMLEVLQRKADERTIREDATCGGGVLIPVGRGLFVLNPFVTMIAGDLEAIAATPDTKPVEVKDAPKEALDNLIGELPERGVILNPRKIASINGKMTFAQCVQRLMCREAGIGRPPGDTRPRVKPEVEEEERRPAIEFEEPEIKVKAKLDLMRASAEATYSESKGVQTAAGAGGVRTTFDPQTGEIGASYSTSESVDVGPARVTATSSCDTKGQCKTTAQVGIDTPVGGATVAPDGRGTIGVGPRVAVSGLGSIEGRLQQKIKINWLEAIEALEGLSETYLGPLFTPFVGENPPPPPPGSIGTPGPVLEWLMSTEE